VQGCVAMGMRRLSIIDLAGGDQPIFNEDRSLAVVFNGEIYNYVELREFLLTKGHHFETRSDTEVLLHLYEEYGSGLLPKLNGMFSFALWDKKQQALLLARDRMGVKPLYYGRIGPRWLFASELKCLLTHPGLDTELDPDGLADYLRLGYVPREGTPYRAVRRLLPGRFLHIRGDRHQLSSWWDLAETDRLQSGSDLSQERLQENFDDAVRLRMRSDVPVASFLSGGLDSSLVTITAQQQSEIPINTFTLGFAHTEFDETPFARAVANQAGTSHRELVASPQDAIDHLPLLLWHMDEPTADSSIIPNYLISRFAAQHVKVCLSGLGGDELFGGYSRYLDAGMGRIRKAFVQIPAAAGVLAPIVAPYHHPWAEELRLASDPSLEWRSYLHRLQIFDTPALLKLGFPAKGYTEEIIESLWNKYPGSDPVSRRQFIDQHTYLPDQILALADRMSMANSLEVRVPFMDYRLVRFAQRLAAPAKQDANDFKIFLKQALGKRCPLEVLNRPKWGFDTPLRRWITHPDLFKVLCRLSEGLCVNEGFVTASAVRSMVKTPLRVFNFARGVWSLLVLEVWLRVRRRLSPPKESLNELLGVPS
jgi:asparagine synthase (glutamine-hydrolysing)